MRRGHDLRAGIALLETIIALAILGAVSAATTSLAITAVDTAARARDAEGSLRRASAFLEAVALWPRSDLDRHLGTRRQGAWRLIVQRPFATLYTIQLTDSSGDRTLLQTAVFRPMPNGPEQ
jgi:type II secretory pathway pseudopilin PulG